MALRIEDYALIGDTHAAALVGYDGSIDWLCLPRFDASACFAALLGNTDNGRWLLAPVGVERATSRRYHDESLVLETTWETESGTVRVTDFMPPRTVEPDVYRIVEGVSGEVDMRTELVLRFDYGRLVPWVRRVGADTLAVAGPDAVAIRADVELRGEDLKTVAEFTVHPGETVTFVMRWHPSHLPATEPEDAMSMRFRTVEWWREWSSRMRYEGPWREEIGQSLRVLKALTYGPTGGIVAAATTSLPEQIGSIRNWDYRYCWLRDAAFSLWALHIGGYTEEAQSYVDWLLRAAGGDPDALQTVYGPAGEGRLPELELDWLAGYEGSRPVRIGNAASMQFQLDVYGEVLDTLHLARQMGMSWDPETWALARRLVEYVVQHWQEPDEGIWEVRGPRQHFTHSKVMAWVALDRAVRAIEKFGLDGPLEEWQRVRQQIHDDVCSKGFDAERNTFTQHYGSKELDASLLMIPLVHFLPATDPRMLGTIAAIQRDLMVDGFVLRYPTDLTNDGLPAGEGAFLACTFWLVDNLALIGQIDEATRLFERLLELRNDVGLLSEEYDPTDKRLLGNFPQAFSHVGLVNSAFNLDRAMRARARAEAPSAS
ncbi:MAG TPA: glycoside hydrolase family 15 protein [Candidatus Limnocylindrales bacterium]|nr:glycoside hydrolase family 15 protein [Candidatus Limnocylindrales bacterium]